MRRHRRRGRSSRCTEVLRAPLARGDPDGDPVEEAPLPVGLDLVELLHRDDEDLLGGVVGILGGKPEAAEEPPDNGEMIADEGELALSTHHVDDLGSWHGKVNYLLGPPG